jgi:glycine oxidase
MLAATVRGGLSVEGDKRVDPRTVTAALRVACERSGVRFVADRVGRLCLDPSGTRVTGVVLGNEGTDARPADLQARTVVLALGAASGDLPGLPAADRPPTRPVKGQILTVRCEPGEPLLRRAVRGLVHGASFYLVPRPDGRIVIGGTVEERGWDTRSTAGAVYELLRDAALLVPGISECELVETMVGFRPGTPDNAPVLGPSPTPGLVHACGHFRNGILLTPVTADTIAEVVTTGATPEVIGSFGIERFTARSELGAANPPIGSSGTANAATVDGSAAHTIGAN